VPGVRVFYQPIGRRRLALILAILAVLDYLKEAVGDLANIDHRPLKFDFGQFQNAAQALSDGRNPYDVFVGLHCQSWCLGGYIYTPLLAELLRPIAHLPLPRAASIWLILSHVMVLATVLVLWRILRGHTTTTALLMMLAAGLLFQPLFENLSYVQIGILLLLILAIAAAFHLRSTPWANAWAGALVGLATVIKVTPVLVAPALMPVGWARRKYRPGATREGLLGIAGIAAANAGLVLAMLVLVPHTADFFTQVLPHIGGGTTVYENKSFASMVGRFFDLTGEVEPGWGLAAPDSRLVTLATLAIFLGPTIWLAARTVPRDGMDWTARAAVFAAFVAAMPIVSTITWRHHMVVNILAMALLLPALWPLAGPAASQAGRWLLVASYPLSYIQQDVAHRLALGGLAHPTFADAVRVLLIEDLNLFGMICLWLACLLALQGLGPRASELGGRSR
jgi:alpha-1,2-mannosyltransferase